MLSISCFAYLTLIGNCLHVSTCFSSQQVRGEGVKRQHTSHTPQPTHSSSQASSKKNPTRNHTYPQDPSTPNSWFLFLLFNLFDPILSSPALNTSYNLPRLLPYPSLNPPHGTKYPQHQRSTLYEQNNANRPNSPAFHPLNKRALQSRITHTYIQRRRKRPRADIIQKERVSSRDESR